MRKRIGLVVTFLGLALVGSMSGRNTVLAEANTGDEGIAVQDDSAGQGADTLFLSDDLSNGMVTATWSDLSSNTGAAIVSYELEVSVASDFAEASSKTYTIDAASLGETNAYSFSISDISSKGAKLYSRVRALELGTDAAYAYTEYTYADRSYTYLKISDSNFKGMTKLLKSGYNSSKKKYDSNKDGWLSDRELLSIVDLTNYKVKKVKKGKYELDTTAAKGQAEVTGFQGIQYFKNLKNINIVGFKQKTVNLTKSNAETVNLMKVRGKKLVVKAPNAVSIIVTSDESKNKLKAIDLSKCNNAVEITAKGTFLKYVDLKLPSKGSHLMSISMTNIKGHKVDLNKYKNLREYYMYSCQASTLKANKCKELRYAYFYISSSIKNVDLRKNKKMKGVCAYFCAQLPVSKIKTVKACKKVGNNPSIWWSNTKDYKKNVTKPISKAKAKYSKV